MAKLRPDFFDNKGNHHPTAERATIADMVELFGFTEAYCGDILAKRVDLERIFAEHDAMEQATGNVARLPVKVRP